MPDMIIMAAAEVNTPSKRKKKTRARSSTGSSKKGADAEEGTRLTRSSSCSHASSRIQSGRFDFAPAQRSTPHLLHSEADSMLFSDLRQQLRAIDHSNGLRRTTSPKQMSFSPSDSPRKQSPRQNVSHSLMEETPRILSRAALGRFDDHLTAKRSNSPRSKSPSTSPRDAPRKLDANMWSKRISRINFGFTSRLNALRRLNDHVVKDSNYRRSIWDVIRLMVDSKMTLNHVNGKSALDGLKQTGSLRAPALDCMLGYDIRHVDKDDIIKGIGYYHFNRVSAGSMQGATNFNLNRYDEAMFFINPHVLLEHHFIVCKGNVARSTKQDAPGRLDSMMSEDEALSEALLAVEKLKGMLQEGVNEIPIRNEIAIFEGIESKFIYPHVAVLHPSIFSDALLPHTQPAEGIFFVTPMTNRHKAGEKAMRLKAKQTKTAYPPVIIRA